MLVHPHAARGEDAAGEAEVQASAVIAAGAEQNRGEYLNQCDRISLTDQKIQRNPVTQTSAEGRNRFLLEELW